MLSNKYDFLIYGDTMRNLFKDKVNENTKP